MKHVLVLGGRSTDLNEREILQEYARYFEAALDGDIECKIAHFDELSFIVAPGEFRVYDHYNDTSFEDYDAVFFRGKIRANSELAYCVSRFLIVNNKPFFNDYSPYRPASKLAQAITFFESKVPFLKTVYASDPAILYDVTVKEFEAPYIAKDSYGAHGNNNYLVKDAAELKNILMENTGVRFLTQVYFPNDCDYRVLVMGEHETIIRRQAAGSHLNNTSQGGTAELVSASFFSTKALADAHAVATQLRMGIAGVDLLFNERTQEHYFLEVNSQPQLQTGAFPEAKQEKVGAYLRSLLLDEG